MVLAWFLNPDGPHVVSEGPRIFPHGPSVVPDGPHMVSEGPPIVPHGPSIVPVGSHVVPDVL